jgi:hypothetical protein
MRSPLSASAGFHSGKPGCFILTNVHFPVACFAPALDALRSRGLPSLVIIVRRLISRAHNTYPVGSGIVVVFARCCGRQRGSLPFS